MKVCAWVSYGMGGASLDPAGGEALLVRRLNHIGVDTRGSPYRWCDITRIITDIRAVKFWTKDSLITVGGDSLGANEAPAIAASLPHIAFDFLFGFQRSAWGVQVDLTPNVKEALSIYNPGALGFLATLGMGSDPWTLSPSNKTTKLQNIPIKAAHPDDFGIAQDIVFGRIHNLVMKG